MKKRTLNKLFSISLTAAMALGMLSGCGNTASNTGTASPAETGTATTESTDTASSGDKTAISIYRASFNQATVDSDEVKKVQDAINDYIADKNKSCAVQQRSESSLDSKLERFPCNR